LVWQAVQHGGIRLIYLLRLIILARLLAPGDFGLLAIAMVAVEFLVHVTEFGMIPALVQREELDERHYDAAWTVGMLRASAITIVVILAAPLIAGFFAEPRATPIIQVLALRPVLQAAASIKVAELTRGLHFRKLALLRLFEALATALVSIALALPLGVWALVAGSLAGPAVYAAMSYVWARHRPRLSLERGVVSSLIRFGRWIFLTSLIAEAAHSLFHAAISRQLGVVDLGIYFLAAKLAFLPLEVASGVVSGVAFPVYSRLQSNLPQVTRALRSQLIGMSVLLFPALGLIIALAPAFTEEILGPRWIGTAPVIRLLAVASLLGLLGDAGVSIFKGIGQAHRETVLEAAQSTLLVALVWTLAGSFGLFGAAFAWLPALLVSQIICAMFLRQIFARPFEGLGKPILAITVVSALGAGIAFGVNHALTGVVGLVAGVLLAMVVMGALTLAVDRRLELGLGDLFARAFPKAAATLGYSASSTGA
jgi:O-antigen/teichoic acid export membrane protein